MSEPIHSDVARLIKSVTDGVRMDPERLVTILYDELRALARRMMVNEPAGQSLQTTALVHEAYLRLLGGEDLAWRDRGHFFGAAAQAMRRILVERARKRHALKRGGGRDRLPLTESMGAAMPRSRELLALDEALSDLEGVNPPLAQVVMLRYFAGLTIAQTALALGTSEASVSRDWAYAKAWLYDRMTRQDRDSS